MVFAKRLTYEVFAPLTARKIFSSGPSSPDLSLLSRVLSHRRRRRGLPRDGCLPCGLLPFGVFPAPGSHSPWGYQLPGTCPLSVSHALRALLRPASAGLVSCRSRPWGFTLQGRSPLTEPCALSGAAALLWLAGDPGSVPTTAARWGSWGCPRSLRQPVEETARPTPAPLQGLAPGEWPCRRADCSGQPLGRDPRGFRLPRGFSLFAGDPPRGPSSHGLRSRRAR